MYSGITCESVAPSLVMRTNPLMPSVEGAMTPSTFQNVGTAGHGQLRPETNKKNSEEKRMIIMQLSRVLMKWEMHCPRKHTASR